MRIEQAAPEQYEAICAVLAEGDAVHEEQLPEIFCKKVGPTRPRDFLVQRMLGPESAVLVALEGSAIVGVLEIVMKPPPERDGHVPRRVALIDNLAVRGSHRRRGIATQLMASAERWATEQGAVAMELNVWAFNAPAKRLYERLGYETRVVRMERALGGG